MSTLRENIDMAFDAIEVVYAQKMEEEGYGELDSHMMGPTFICRDVETILHKTGFNDLSVKVELNVPLDLSNGGCGGNGGVACYAMRITLSVGGLSVSRDYWGDGDTYEY
jgi:hypothetical protein